MKKTWVSAFGVAAASLMGLGCGDRPSPLDSEGSQIVDQDTFTVEAQEDLAGLGLEGVLGVHHAANLEFGSARIVEVLAADAPIGNVRYLVLAFSDEYGDHTYDLGLYVESINSFAETGPGTLTLTGTRNTYVNDEQVGESFTLDIDYAANDGPTRVTVQGDELPPATGEGFEVLGNVIQSDNLYAGTTDANFVHISEGGEPVINGLDILQINPTTLYLSLGSDFVYKVFRLGEFIEATGFTTVAENKIAFDVELQTRELESASYRYTITFARDSEGEVADKIQVSYREVTNTR